MGPSLEVRSPYDSSLIATLQASDASQVEAALARAYAIYRDRKRWLPVAQRLEILRKAGVLLQERSEALALEAAREGGKPLIDSRVEVVRAVDGIQCCIDALREHSGSVIPMQLNPASAGRIAFTQFEPIGVVAALSAFNHPVNLIIHQVGPAVSAGCPILIKPASNTPLSCQSVVKIFHEAGLPPDYCQLILTHDNELATKMVSDPRVAFLSFIGSAKVGWTLRSKLAPGARCSLEHGGVAPVIVAEDADLEQAVPILTKGAFYHAGQVCVSVKRVFAHKKIARALAEKLASAAQQLRIGDPTDPKTEVGPLIRKAEVERVAEWVQEAVQGGAELLSGGQRVSESCFACTVLFNPPEDAKVSREEVFGPVLCVYSIEDLEEGIGRANQLEVSFQAAVFSKNLDTALYCYQQLDASAVMVNDHTAFRVDWMPFAGLKNSGLGVGGIPFTLRDMQVEKMAVIRSAALSNSTGKMAKNGN